MTSEQKAMAEERISETRKVLDQIQEKITKVRRDLDNTNLAKGLWGPNNRNVKKFDQEWGEHYRKTLEVLNGWKSLLEEELTEGSQEDSK